jgi:hypothetical protein
MVVFSPRLIVRSDIFWSDSGSLLRMYAIFIKFSFGRHFLITNCCCSLRDEIGKNENCNMNRMNILSLTCIVKLSSKPKKLQHVFDNFIPKDFS